LEKSEYFLQAGNAGDHWHGIFASHKSQAPVSAGLDKWICGSTIATGFHDNIRYTSSAPGAYIRLAVRIGWQIGVQSTLPVLTGEKTMDISKKHIDEMLESLKEERDELRVKLQLAKMDAGDEWHKLEGKLHKLEAKAKELGSATADASGDIGSAAKLLAEEIRDGFKKVIGRL